MKTWFHKITAGIILVAIVAMVVLPGGVLLFPKKAEAQTSCIAGIITNLFGKILGGILGGLGFGGGKVPVAEKTVQSNTGKIGGFTAGSWFSECVIKPAIKAAVKTMIHQFLGSIVDWINNGFEGSGPRFISDPADFFARIADQAIGEMIYGSDLKFLCSPFALDIRLALGLHYWGGGKFQFRDRIRCTLSDVIGNVTSAGDRLAYRNSWQSWLDITTKPQNNPYGAFALAKSELEIRIANQKFVAKTEADWGSGFLATKRCVPLDPGLAEGRPMSDPITAEGEPICERWETVTPGKLVQEGIGKVVGAQVDEYVSAQDIDAIFIALSNQMFNKIASIFSNEGIFSGTTRGANYYRDKFEKDQAAGVFKVGTGATAPAGFGSFQCSTIGKYVANANNINVDYIKDTGTVNVTASGDGMLWPAPWPETGPRPLLTDSTQYKVYSQLTKYCSQLDFWNDSRGAIDNSIPATDLSSDNACSTQTKIYSNDILSTNSSGFEVRLTEGGGGPDLAVDGTSMTYARLIGYPPWLEIILKNQEVLSSIRFQTWRSEDTLGAGSVMNLYNTSVSATPLSISPNIETTTGTFIINLTLPARIQKIRIQQGTGSELRIAEITMNRYAKPVVNWTGGTAQVGVPFDVFDGVLVTNCNDNTIMTTSPTFTVAPLTAGATWTTDGNMVTFNTIGTYYITYTGNDGTADSDAFRRTITVGNATGSGVGNTNPPPSTPPPVPDLPPL